MPQIIQKLRRRLDATHQQMIPSPRAGYVEQVALGVVDLFEVRVVGYGLDSFLQREDLVVARHHGHSPEFEALGQVHGADRDASTGGFDVLVERLVGEAGGLGRRSGAVQPDRCVRLGGLRIFS
jgi:hypothetical protein